MNLKKISYCLACVFVSGSVNAAVQPPRNTLDIKQPMLTTNTFGTNSVTQLVNLPPDIKNQVIPSTAVIVGEQVSQAQQAQLSPEQRKALKEIELEIQRSQVSPYNTLPYPAVRSISPNLAPGVTPPIINVSKNMLTNIVFTDMEGNPWYIDKVLLNRSHFNDNAGIDPQGKKTNVLTLEPVNPFEYGNVTVMLEGKTLPVIFMAASGQPTVDVRIDARMQGKNPSAASNDFNPANLMISSDIDEVGLRFLDGNIPEDAESLLSSDAQANGWKYGNYLYVKTRLDVLYPAYNSRATSPDGYNIYRFDNDPSSITFMQRNGQPVTSMFTESPYQYDK